MYAESCDSATRGPEQITMQHDSLNHPSCEKRLNVVNVMPRLYENERRHVVGILETGMPQIVVARHFSVYQDTIQSLWRRYQ